VWARNGDRRGHGRPAATNFRFHDFRFLMPSCISSDVVFRGLDSPTTVIPTSDFFKKVERIVTHTNTRRLAGEHGHPVGARAPSAPPRQKPPKPPEGGRTARDQVHAYPAVEGGSPKPPNPPCPARLQAGFLGHSTAATPPPFRGWASFRKTKARFRDVGAVFARRGPHPPAEDLKLHLRTNPPTTPSRQEACSRAPDCGYPPKTNHPLYAWLTKVW
jgi:hypothetical protein